MHHLTRIHYFAKAGSQWAEHELDHVIFLKADVDLSHINSDEVQQTMYVNQNQLKILMHNASLHNVLITPWFRYIYDRFLFDWWVNLNDLSECKDDLIHRAGNQTVI